MNKNELISLFEQTQQVSNEEIEQVHQKLNAFSNSIQTLILVREIFQENVNNVHIAYMCLLMAKEVLHKRGAILQKDQFDTEILGFYELFQSNSEAMKANQLLITSASDVIASIFRIHLSIYQNTGIFQIFQRYPENEVIREISINSLLELFNYFQTKLYFETDSSFKNARRKLTEESYNLLSLVDLSTKLGLELILTIFTFDIGTDNYWSFKPPISRNYLRSFQSFATLETAQQILNVVLTNQELSRLAAEVFQYLITMLPHPSIKSQVKALIQNSFQALKESITEDNSAMILCIILRTVTELTSSDYITNEFIESFQTFTESITDIDSVHILINIWAQLSTYAHQQCKGNFEKYEICSISGKLFGHFVLFLSSLPEELISDIILDPLFDIKFGRVWELTIFDFMAQMQNFIEVLQNSSLGQLSMMLSLVALLFTENIRGKILIYVEEPKFCKSYADIIISSVTAINVLSKTFIPKENLPLISEAIDVYDRHFLPNVIGDSRSLQKKINRIIGDKTHKDVDHLQYLILKNLFLGLQRFPNDFDIISNYLQSIEYLISSYQIRYNAEKSKVIFKYISGEIGLNIETLDPFDQSFLYQKYFAIINTMIKLGSYTNNSDLNFNLLNSFHEDLVSIDVNDHINCLILLRRIYGFISSPKKIQEIAFKFVISEDHNQKFCEIAKSCGEHVLLAQIICEIYTSVSKFLIDTKTCNEDSLILVHMCKNLLDLISDLENSTEKINSAIILLENMITGKYVNYAAMRFFGDNMIDQLAEIFFTIIKSVDENSWMKEFVLIMNELWEIDQSFFHNEENLVVALKWISRTFLTDDKVLEEKSAKILENLVTFCGEELGPFIQPLVLIFDSTMNHQNPPLVNYAYVVRKLLQTATSEIIQFMQVALTCFDDFIQEEVHGIFQKLIDSKPDEFPSNFKVFATEIKRYKVVLSDLPQFTNIFRESY
ncbi:hypothetical protein TVAG_149480 [Trichomonas vaginalis G3]|uniref:Uncharacterized protein n=1 Tax=Trichomonas vaginalis (strain ATCC PRA-98 / G3) TaxID=412133 RepID=A2ELL5_TRIV3|nr:armadillo (ARM) repeat-containing protein family [Trichomonas vaginalis G3]EAY06462.1 hypothetical protein TVAG_149480 [Trichomonas vaginalis G3]KAI5548010.1 armadillo (ARM) repeat-containing protein family [Trichomonas vaginalis G3]|eukprot:XP_001318685.1 hypothetical protein [Trichomonas vaginalis G3]